jgi:hypothetical protein
MDPEADLDALEPGVEVLLFCLVGADLVRVLARKHWFPTEDPKQRREGWQSTWNGEELPKDWRPYAYCNPQPPDPALIEDGY